MADDELFLISQTVENPTNCRTNSVDPTLGLPDHLLQSIFSQLNFHDLVNVRLVSRNWHRNAPSHVALHFNESLFREKNPSNESSHGDFGDWIRSSLDACNTKLINAEKRVLRVQFKDCGTIHDVMRLLDGNGFHEVYLNMKLLIVRSYCYYLPYIFQSKFITVLHLTKCGLDNRVLCGTKEIIPSLQELKLDGVTSCEETLSMFISKCPYLTELSLVNCCGISFILLPKLDRLKKFYVKLRYFHPFTNIQVIAPSLQVFHFVYRSRESRVAVNMDICACKMLREFHLDCWRFPEGLDPEKISSDFPRLETLLLGPCQTENPIEIEISGSLLTNWILSFPRLYECSRKSIVSAPNNLSSFQYMNTTFQPYLALPSDTSKVLESSNIVLVPKINEVNRAWFLKLRSHLQNVSNYNTILDLRLRDKTSSCEHLRDKPSGRAPTQPLHHIKHLMLDMNKLKNQEEYLMRYIIDNLLWMSQPNTLTLSIPTSFAPLAHGVCKELYDRRDRSCCSGTHDKCWRHFLKHFEVKEEVTNEKKNKLTKLIFVFTWRFNS